MVTKQVPGSSAPDSASYVVLTDGNGNLSPAGSGPIGPGGGGEVEGTSSSGATDTGNPVKTGGVFLTTQPTVTTGQRVDAQYTNRGEQKVALSNGAIAVTVTGPGDGVSNSSVGLATTTLNELFGSAAWNRARDITGAATTGIGVGASAPFPTSATAAGVALNALAAVNSALVLKASAGNLYSFTCNAGASAGYVMVFNAIAAPADGAVTPIYVEPVAINSTVTRSFNYPIVCSTGITLVFSTTGPFTKTASATAFLAGQSV